MFSEAANIYMCTGFQATLSIMSNNDKADINEIANPFC